MPKHALLSASGAARWLACTPSARLEEYFESKSSAYAEEGTAAHALAEITARRRLGLIGDDEYRGALNELSKNEFYCAEMQEHAEAYADLVSEKLDAISDAGSLIDFEVSLDFSAFVPGGRGTCDCLIVADGALEIIDFKYGKGYRVEVKNNPQLRLYALGALLAYDVIYDIKKVKTTIFQPRIYDGSSEDEISAEELRRWADEYVRPRAKLAFDGEGDFAPGGDACKFCRARSQCKARYEYNLSLFDNAPDLRLISSDEAGEALKKAADIETWIADLRKLVFSSLANGESVDGWKLVEGRSVRKFVDEKKVAEAMITAGYDEDRIFERSLISLSVMEKAFGKKEVAGILGNLIYKPVGKPSLALISDKKPAITVSGQIAGMLADEGI